MMYCDEIIAEVWRNRDAFTTQHHNNFDEILAVLQKLQRRPNCKIVDRRDLTAKTRISRNSEAIVSSQNIPA